MTTILKDSGVKTFDELKVDGLEVNGDVLIGDDHFIRFGDSQSDMKIGHDPNINFIDHNLQLQFRSSMSSGDSYKFFETGRRTSTYLFASQNNADTEKANYYLQFGNDNTGATNRSFLFEKIRKLDGSGLHTIIEKTQPGNTIDTAVVDTKCKAKFSNEIENDYKTAIVAGSGFDLALLESNIRKIDNEIISTFLIDLDEGPVKSQNGVKIIGENGSSAAHFTQVSAAINGYVYKVELCCIEAPVGGNTDIDLVFNAASQSTGSTSFTSVVNGGAQVRGRCSQALLDGSFDLDLKFLHLANGSGSSTGDYTAGKFIVKLYAANF